MDYTKTTNQYSSPDLSHRLKNVAFKSGLSIPEKQNGAVSGAFCDALRYDKIIHEGFPAARRAGFYIPTVSSLLKVFLLLFTKRHFLSPQAAAWLRLKPLRLHR